MVDGKRRGHGVHQAEGGASVHRILLPRDGHGRAVDRHTSARILDSLAGAAVRQHGRLHRALVFYAVPPVPVLVNLIAVKASAPVKADIGTAIV